MYICFQFFTVKFEKGSTHILQTALTHIHHSRIVNLKKKKLKRIFNTETTTGQYG